MTARRTFFAWHRTGLASALTQAPSGPAARAEVPVRVGLRGSQLSLARPLQLAGPGDVAGIDPRQIRRCEPYDGCADYEPGFLTYVELADPDLPWRFTPLPPAESTLPDPEAGPPIVQRRLMPWIALVAVPEALSRLETDSGGGLSLVCSGQELPDPAELWAWAHVQVVDAGSGEPNAGTGFARLLCPRVLAAQTRYRACVVPTFAAGLTPGRQGSAAPLTPAWSNSAPARLPVYFSFAFATTTGGSFETLARRLRPRTPPRSSAGRLVQVDEPGWGAALNGVPPVVMWGALRPAGGSGLKEPDPDPSIGATLAAAISEPGGGTELRPPIYAQDYAGGVTVVDPLASGWLTELNTDPRRRLAAGLGAWVVAVEQEDLADRAWRQLATERPATRESADPDLADVVGAVLAGAAAVAGVASGADATGAAPASLLRAARAGGPIGPLGHAARAMADVVPDPRPGTSKPVDPGFGPIFPEPAYALLAAVAPDWLLPGIADVEDDSVTLLRTNPRFVESFLLGLNHALTRELQWRRFPVDSTATTFRRFWNRADGGTDGELSPIAGWAPASSLGSHAGRAEDLVLLIRGAVLRRHPEAAVYLAGDLPDGTEARLAPSLVANLSAGTSLFGFPLTAAEASNPTSGAGSPASWSVVIQEALHHSRFGCDETRSGAGPFATWTDLDLNTANPGAATHLPVVSSGLAGITRPLAPGGLAVTWGTDAGAMATVLQRPAFRIRIPLRLWLQPAVASA